MCKFLLNQQLVEEDLPASALVLDVVRHRHGLTVTKEVCREGDCGACQVLVGKLIESHLQLKFPSFSGDNWAGRGIFNWVCFIMRKTYRK